MDRTPKKWSERKATRGQKPKENVVNRGGGREQGRGDSESEEDSVITEFSTRTCGARLSKNPHVLLQRKKWREHLEELKKDEEEMLQKQLAEVKRESRNHTIKWMFLSVITSVLLFLLVQFYVWPLYLEYNQKESTDGQTIRPHTSNSLTISWDEGQAQFKEAVRTLARTYTHQSRETWIQFISSFTSTLTENPPVQPSSVVILTPPSLDSGFAPCLARKLGKVAHSVFYNVTRTQHTQRILELDSNYFLKAATVTEIHEKLQTYLKNAKVVIIHNAHLINQQDRLMIFHAFCDNTAAPQKRATFLFIIPTPVRIYGKYSGTHEEAATISSEIMESAWTSLGPDKKPALIARVATANVILKAGDRCIDE